MFTFRYSRAVIDGRLSLGVLMYWRNAALFHLPSIVIVESSRPACAAAVAHILCRSCGLPPLQLRPPLRLMLRLLLLRLRCLVLSS